MRHVRVFAVLCAAAFNTSAQIPMPTALPTPTDPNAIVLNTPTQPPTVREQWESMGPGRIARNVTTSTLTPYLPDPAKATGASVIVAPGGAFMMLSMDSEGYQVAQWLADHGIAAFVLKYRVKPTEPDPKAFMKQLMTLLTAVSAPGSKDDSSTPQVSVEDARAAVKLVRSRAAEWHVDPARIGITGFSSGADLTLAIGLDADPALRPNFIALIYGDPSTALNVPPDAPPMFFALAANDPFLGKASFDLINSWRAAGRPVEFHLYEKGGHGFGMNQQGASSDLWIEEFYTWMKDRGELKAAK
jgi:acetyl esterase/lipase